MASITKTKNRVFAAKSFLKSLLTENIFFYIGKTDRWTSLDSADASENTPPSVIDSVSDDSEVWRTMIHAKKILPSDCTLVARRYDWQRGMIYREYSQDDALFMNVDQSGNPLNPFYVVTSALNVYKCLSNGGGLPSFNKPTGTSVNPTYTGDGYLWKYMFTIQPDDDEKWSTDEFIPVKTLESNDGSIQWQIQQSAIPGTIDVIKVVDGGSGFAAPPELTISGDGTGAKATCTIANGQIDSIFLTNRGKNYTRAEVTVPSGRLTSLVIVDPGSGYVSAPTVTFAGGGGSGAVATAVINNGLLVSLIVTNPGSGYTSAPEVIISGNARATALISTPPFFKPIISPQGGHGSDPVNELGAAFVMLTVQLEYDEGGDAYSAFTTSNDFRRTGMVLNPLSRNSSAVYSANLATQAWGLTLIDVTGGFNADDVVVGSLSGATGVVLDTSATANGTVLRVVNVSGTFIPGEVIQDSNVAVNGTLLSTSGTVRSANSATISIASSDTMISNGYSGSTISITSGVGAGQSRLIVANDSTTKIITIDQPWDTVPNGSSQYAIAYIRYPDLQPYTGDILQSENRRALMRSDKEVESARPVIDF